MKAENFVFKGKFFINSKELEKIKNALIDLLRGEGYMYVSPISFFHNFLSMTFCLKLPEISTPISLRFKQLLGIKSKSETSTEVYFKQLAKTKDSVPSEIDISVYFGKINDTDGIIVEVVSKPVIWFKITQLLVAKQISQEEYSFVSVENKQFIEKISRALNGYFIENPKPLDAYISSEILEKLISFGFPKISEMIRKGKEKIELGNSSGLDELRGAIENFLYQFILKINEKPEPLDKPERNIQLIKNLRYIDDDIKRLIESILFKGVYSFLSNVVTHPRKEVDIFTSRLCFDITEDVFDYLIERIIKYKIRLSDIDEKSK